MSSYDDFEDAHQHSGCDIKSQVRKICRGVGCGYTKWRHPPSSSMHIYAFAHFQSHSPNQFD